MYSDGGYIIKYTFKFKSSTVNKNGPLIFIDDDEDDQLVVRSILADLNFPNPVLFFSNGADALEYVRTCSRIPFVIVSDINMPMMSGVELFRAIIKLERTDIKATPLIFMSTNPERQSGLRIPTREIQGIFKKPVAYEDNLKMWETIVNYWKTCDKDWGIMPDSLKFN